MKPFLKLIIPEKAELILFISLGLILLVVQDAQILWLALGGSDAVSIDTGNNLGAHISYRYHIFEDTLDPRIADFVVWMLIGSIMFTIVSYVIAAAKSASDEAELVHYYRSPKGRSHELNAFFSKIAMRAVGVFGFIVWLVVFIQAINPALTKSFFVSATNLGDASSWLWLVVSVVAMAMALYVFAIFARIVALRPRVFGTSEEV